MSFISLYNPPCNSHKRCANQWQLWENQQIRTWEEQGRGQELSSSGWQLYSWMDMQPKNSKPMSHKPQSPLLWHCPSTCKSGHQHPEGIDNIPEDSDSGRRLCARPETMYGTPVNPKPYTSFRISEILTEHKQISRFLPSQITLSFKKI